MERLPHVHWRVQLKQNKKWRRAINVVKLRVQWSATFHRNVEHRGNNTIVKIRFQTMQVTCEALLLIIN